MNPWLPFHLTKEFRRLERVLFREIPRFFQGAIVDTDKPSTGLVPARIRSGSTLSELRKRQR